MEGYAQLCISGCAGNARYSADPDGASVQIDLIGVPWLNIGFEPSVAPNGGYLKASLSTPHLTRTSAA